MREQGWQCGKKNLLHWSLEARYYTALQPLKSLIGVLKTTYEPLIDTALYLMLLMRTNPLLGQVGGGWVLEMDLPTSKALRTGPNKL
jgi:hypothetical protein